MALQYYFAFTVMRSFAEEKRDAAYLAYLAEEQTALGEKIQKLCWNGDRFLRGFTESGETIGERSAPEANLWLNPQSWAVISGLLTKLRRIKPWSRYGHGSIPLTAQF